MKPYLIFTLFLILSQNSYSQSQADLNIKWCDKLSVTKLELDSVVSIIKMTYSADKVFIKNLYQAQKNWELLLEADMEMYMPTEEYWGSAEAMCECQFKDQLIKKRIRFLKNWIQPGERKGWMCGGTILFDNEQLLIIDGERF